jgi:hypothetical protein
MKKDVNWIRPYHRLALTLVLLLLFPGMTAGLQAGEDSEFYKWTALSAEDQLAADQTPVPADAGAIFVPAMTDGDDEPLVLVFRDEQKIASGNTGTRIVVDPGACVVRVGSGAIKQMMTYEVEVSAGETTVVEAAWGGLKIEVVDENNIPHRGTYEIIRAEDRELFGIGYGADTLQAEPLGTWLLSPGLYRIVRTGETYRARQDFATVVLPEGGLVHFKLVIDPDTGNFRGAGVAMPDELGIVDQAVSNWAKSMTVGLAGALNDTSDVVGVPNQTSYSGVAFFDTYLTYTNGPHFGSGIIELEEGFLKVDPEIGRALPTQKTRDRLRTDLLYTRFFKERIGPYVRAGFLTNVFAANTLATEDLNIAYNRLDGTRDVIFVPANSNYQTADSFGNLRFREGVGANLRLFKNRHAALNWRLGVGLRQNVFSDLYVLMDDPTTDEIDFFEVDDFNQEGIESTITGNARITRYLSYITDLEVFFDFDDMGEPTIDWRNNLSLRLTRHLSLDYVVDILKFPQVVDTTQTSQSLLLRFSFDLL